MNSILEDLERRKRSKENPCDICNGSGIATYSTSEPKLACGLCLGQGIRLTDDERQLLMEQTLTGSDYSDDEILNATELTYSSTPQD